MKKLTRKTTTSFVQEAQEPKVHQWIQKVHDQSLGNSSQTSSKIRNKEEPIQSMTSLKANQKRNVTN